MPVIDLYARMTWEQLVWACAERCVAEFGAVPPLRADPDADPRIGELRQKLAGEEERLAKFMTMTLDGARAMRGVLCRLLGHRLMNPVAHNTLAVDERFAFHLWVRQCRRCRGYAHDLGLATVGPKPT